MRDFVAGRGVAAVALVIGLLGAPAQARADGAEAGGYLGAAFPVGHYSDTVDIGGVVGGYGGYRWHLGDGGGFFALTGGPQFTIMPTDCELCDILDDDDITSTFSFTAGPKFGLIDGRVEATIAALGGYFRDISGPLDGEAGGGFAIHGTVSYLVAHGITVGLFARFEQMWLQPEILTNKDDRQMVHAGIQVGWHAAPEVIVAETAVAPPPPPPPPPVARKKLVLRGVNFDFDKSTLQPAGVPILNEAAKILKDNPNVNVQVQGYTDSIGTDAYNLRLSDRRAGTVKNYLVKEGVASSRLTTKGFGESNPVATNETAEGRAQNRRVELIPQ